MRRRFMVDQPQVPQALQTRDVTRFGEMLASQWGNPGLISCHGSPSPPAPLQKIPASPFGYVLF